MTRQYPLPLPHREAMEADDFMVTASNGEAAAWLDKWPDWPAHCLVIYGPAGAGKTHLAHVWQAQAAARLIDAKTIAEEDIATLKAQAVAIDDAEKAAGERAREEALLHLYNMLRENKGYLLLTARQAPAHWEIGLPDLRSRLLAVPAVALGAPDDELVAALLVKQLRDRQIEVGMEVIDYLVPRLDRTPEAIRKLVAALDRASLAEGRRITVALARKVLDDGAAA
jgi:DnaA regulatory inactivator Hda